MRCSGSLPRRGGELERGSFLQAPSISEHPLPDLHGRRKWRCCLEQAPANPLPCRKHKCRKWMDALERRPRPFQRNRVPCLNGPHSLKHIFVRRLHRKALGDFLSYCSQRFSQRGSLCLERLSPMASDTLFVCHGKTPAAFLVRVYLDVKQCISAFHGPTQWRTPGFFKLIHNSDSLIELRVARQFQRRDVAQRQSYGLVHANYP
jgi:hypothetical protein